MLASRSPRVQQSGGGGSGSSGGGRGGLATIIIILIYSDTRCPNRQTTLVFVHGSGALGIPGIRLTLCTYGDDTRSV